MAEDENADSTEGVEPPSLRESEGRGLVSEVCPQAV